MHAAARSSRSLLAWRVVIAAAKSSRRPGVRPLPPAIASAPAAGLWPRRRSAGKHPAKMGGDDKAGGDADQQIEIWKVKRVSTNGQGALGQPRRRAAPRRLPQPRSWRPLRRSAPPLSLLVQLIKALDNARGNGTSMISLIMPPKSQVPPAAAARCRLRMPALRVGAFPAAAAGQSEH